MTLGQFMSCTCDIAPKWLAYFSQIVRAKSVRAEVQLPPNCVTDHPAVSIGLQSCFAVHVAHMNVACSCMCQAPFSRPIQSHTQALHDMLP